MASARWRRRRRIGCVLPVVVLALLAVLVATGWPGVGAVASLLGALVIATLVVTVILLGARVLRSTAAPVGELIDAAGRVQSGDYTARVTETGPTELRSLARAFNQMSERLGRTDQQRRSLMADVSHELRTPLTVIQGQLEAIRDGIYPADAEHLGPALDQVVVLDRLVDDLRTLALTESGSLHLAREPTDLGALVTETVHGFDTAVRSADISLSVTVATDLPRVALDPARIGGVIRNLVANAVRYTPPGGVVTLAVQRAEPTHVSIRVHDTGRGIDPALLSAVFERFSRSPDSTGSGLGLAIARSVVEAHGGTITAESELGTGTTITVRLPVGV